MSRPELEERIKTLTQAKAEAIANANALTGAIQECQHWLQVITEQEKQIAAHQ